MNWEAIGAIGEIVGAIAVVFTLLLLAIQIRASTKATLESNRLNRAAALDRHSDSIGRWRGRLAERADLMRIWRLASTDGELTEIELLQAHNLWIEFVNIQRSNYVRSLTVEDPGLTRQAVVSVAMQAAESNQFSGFWTDIRPWAELASPDFVVAVDEELARVRREGSGFANFPSVFTKEQLHAN